MKKEQIHFGDWQRMFLGEVPPVFYLELIIRALIIYLILMVSMRAMGKRMSAQLSRNELAALVSMAAAVGVPMMAPNRGILPAVVIAIIVCSIQRALALRSAKNQDFEKTSQGNVSTLISASVIDLKVLSGVGLSQAELFAQLRGNSITQLGMVDRFYMEANGSFTLIKKEEAEAGLTVLPDADPDFIKEMMVETNVQVCLTCGTKKYTDSDQTMICPNCHHDSWTHAVK
jgi:uncharacterized membrane protein YcaP (DUF421 family)